jgi:hypothetical protein
LKASSEARTDLPSALYVLNYSGHRTANAQTGIARIEYTGDCRPMEPKAETPVTLERRYGAGPGLSWTNAGALRVEISSRGTFRLRVSDVKGRLVATRTGSGRAGLDLEEIRKPAIYFLSVIAAEGGVTRKLLME